VFVAHEGDYKLDSFTLALALSRQLGSKEQKIAIAGDADFISNMRPGSQLLAKNYLSWMTEEALRCA
jgi:ABC-2 type transport system permease protein